MRETIPSSGFLLVLLHIKILSMINDLAVV